MFVYILNYLSLMWHNVITKRLKGGRKVFVTIVSIQFFLLLFLKEDYLGVDFQTYIPCFSYISTLSFGELMGKLHFLKVADLIYPYSIESGYVVLNWIISFFGGNFRTFWFLYALFFSITLGVFIYRYSQDIMLSYMLILFLGVFTNSFGIIRQTLAMCVCLCSINSIETRNLKKFLIINVLAFMIHRISAIFLLLYFLYDIKITKQFMQKIIFIIGITYLSSGFIIKFVINPIMRLLGKGIIGNGQGSMNFLLLFFMLLLFLIVVSVDYERLDSFKELIFKAFIIAFILEILGTYNDEFARSVQLFMPLISVLIPDVICNSKILLIRKIGRYVCSILALLFYIYELKDSSIVPYVTFF